MTEMGDHTSNRPHASKTQSELVMEAATSHRIAVRHGHVILYLRTQDERNHPFPRDSVLLNTYQAMGTVNRMRQLEYILNPFRAQFGFTDIDAPEDAQDIVGGGRIQYALSEAEAKKKIRAQKCGNEIDENLEIVDRKYAENFEWEWQDFQKRFEEDFKVKAWSDSK